MSVHFMVDCIFLGEIHSMDLKHDEIVFVTFLTFFKQSRTDLSSLYNQNFTQNRDWRKFCCHFFNWQRFQTIHFSYFRYRITCETNKYSNITKSSSWVAGCFCFHSTKNIIFIHKFCLKLFQMRVKKPLEHPSWSPIHSWENSS